MDSSANETLAGGLLSGTSADFDLAIAPPPELGRMRQPSPDGGVPQGASQRLEGPETASPASPAARERSDVEPDAVPVDVDVMRLRERQPSILDPVEFGAVRAGRSGLPLALVADDDKDIRTLAARLLERSGFEVVTAVDGDEALQLAIERQPAVCILDWMMPKRSGLDVLESLRSGAQTTGTPVLFLTARAASSDVAQGLKAGADGYLTKPFTADELRQCVEELVEPRAA